MSTCGQKGMFGEPTFWLGMILTYFGWVSSHRTGESDLPEVKMSRTRVELG